MTRSRRRGKGSIVTAASAAIQNPKSKINRRFNNTMRKFISYTVALAVILALPGMALAGTKGTKPFEGKVTAVDTTANTITVAKDKKDSQTFKAADAKVTVDGKSAKLADVTIGMKSKNHLSGEPLRTQRPRSMPRATTREAARRIRTASTPTPTAGITGQEANPARLLPGRLRQFSGAALLLLNADMLEAYVQ